MNLPRDAGDNVDLLTLRAALPETPNAVLEQVYSAHGRKLEFQQQYGDLDLQRIEWTMRCIRAEIIIASSVHSEFAEWVNAVATRATAWRAQGWSCIDSRPAIRNHWSTNRTWLAAPVLLAGDLVNSDAKFHVVEGHTRIGLLKGLVVHEVIAADSTHMVWIGTGRSA